MVRWLMGGVGLKRVGAKSVVGCVVELEKCSVINWLVLVLRMTESTDRNSIPKKRRINPTKKI